METNEKWYIRGKSGCGELIKQKFIESGAIIGVDDFSYSNNDNIYFIVDGMVFCHFICTAAGRYIIRKWKKVEVEEPKPKPHFKPFDRVLMCDGKDCRWGVDLYERYDGTAENYPHVGLTLRHRYCIPYEGNENLIGVMFDPKHIEGYEWGE